MNSKMKSISEHFDGNNRLNGWSLLLLIWIIFFGGIALLIAFLGFLFLILTIVLAPPVHDTLFVVQLVLLYPIVNFILIMLATFVGLMRPMTQQEKQNSEGDSWLANWVRRKQWQTYIFHGITILMGTLVPLVYILIEIIVASSASPYWMVLETRVRAFVIVLWVGMGLLALGSLLNQWCISLLVVGWERLLVKLRLSLRKGDSVY